MRKEFSLPKGLRNERFRTWICLAAIAGFVSWAHFASGIPVFHARTVPAPEWEKFRLHYRIDHFGDDGQFVRAVQNGFDLFFHTHRHASRFTRKTETDDYNTCSSCHSVEDLAYGFVNSDRFDPKRGRRISFEERVQTCYAVSMSGYAPTIYDPAVRDLRLLARAVARHLDLGEGARRSEPAPP